MGNFKIEFDTRKLEQAIKKQQKKQRDKLKRMQELLSQNLLLKNNLS